jgi:hypothetical protein
MNIMFMMLMCCPTNRFVWKLKLVHRHCLHLAAAATSTYAGHQVCWPPTSKLISCHHTSFCSAAAAAAAAAALLLLTGPATSNCGISELAQLLHWYLLIKPL